MSYLLSYTFRPRSDGAAGPPRGRAASSVRRPPPLSGTTATIKKMTDDFVYLRTLTDKHSQQQDKMIQELKGMKQQLSGVDEICKSMQEWRSVVDKLTQRLLDKMTEACEAVDELFDTVEKHGEILRNMPQPVPDGNVEDQPASAPNNQSATSKEKGPRRRVNINVRDRIYALLSSPCI